MTDDPRVWVSHRGGRYPVLVEAGCLDRLPALVEELAPGRRVAVVTDRNVARAVTHSLKVPTLVVPAGEGSKSRTRWKGLTDRLLDLGYGRDSVLVAVGGGVIGDLAGFVAATYLRGIPVVQVPTSLVAMVDASVGGKTGVNTRHGKNLVGAFHPPAGVVIDPAALATLRSGALRDGLVEALKHGLVADRPYYDWIHEQREALIGRDPDRLVQLVRTSIGIKAEIVGADERESGRRAVLNAGHTVGHAIEAVTGYRVSHGEAVAAGLVVEAAVATLLDLAPPAVAPDLAERLAALGVRLGLPPAGLDGRLLAAMSHDKKADRAGLRMALPRAPGALAAAAGGWSVPVAAESVRQALGMTRDYFAG